ncbi:hypothetical protein RR46_00112 [Papilio xuthus]|uniref:C2H2-type domain-containing protein n=1 Tax=Papilio xuthus TaxID=66420 RepID=A0A0N1PGC7_PAPXU|nr:hypothetical protein RR46_00112 [Papilio xuthus]
MNLTSLTKLSILRLDPLNIDTENPLMDSLMDTEQIQPMTFVKLESPQNVSMESEDCDLDIKIHESMNLTSLTKLSILRLDPLNIDTENPLMDSLMDTEQIQPMTFVKLESPQNVSMESEDCDLDIKLDTTDPFITKENCHSDEEPLTNKKTTRKKVEKNPKKNKSTTKKKRTKVILFSLQYSTLNKLRLHMKQHSERVKCDQCDKTFVDRSAMRNHLL